jgi:hypothetical protein
MPIDDSSASASTRNDHRSDNEPMTSA